MGFSQKASQKLHIFAYDEVAGFAGDLVGLRKKAGFARLFSSRLRPTFLSAATAIVFQKHVLIKVNKMHIVRWFLTITARIL